MMRLKTTPGQIALTTLVTIAALSMVASAKRTVVTIWTHQDFDVRWGASHHAVLWGPFEKKNPDIEIKWTRPADYPNKILTAYASGSGPDIFTVDGINMPAWADRGMLEPIDKYISAAVKQDYWKTCLDEMTWKGKLYGLGLETNSQLAFYNPGILAKAGLAGPAKHWDELDEQAKKLSVDANGDGTFEQYCAETPIGNADEYGTWFNTVLIWANDGDVFEDGKPLLNQKKAVDALQWYQNACYKGRVFTTRTGLKLQSGGFVGQKIAYSWAGPFNFGIYEKQCKFKWDVAPTPWSRTGKRVSGVGGWHFAMSRSSKQKVAAAKVMQYLSSADFVRTLADSYGMPVRTSVVKELGARNTYPWSVAVEQMSFGKARPRHPRYKYISDAIWKAFSDVIYKQVPVQARLDMAAKEIDVALSKK